MNSKERLTSAKHNIEEDKLQSLKAIVQEMLLKTISYTQELLSDASNSSELKARTQQLVDATTEAIADASLAKPKQPELASAVFYPDDYVVIHNDLLCSIDNLEPFEKRLILFISAMIRRNAVSQAPHLNKFEIHAKDFALFYGNDLKNTYPRLEAMAKSLPNKTFSMWNFEADDFDKSNGTQNIQFVRSSECIDGEGTLQVELNPALLSFLCVTNASQPHTAYRAKEIARLSIHALTLFELCAYCLSAHKGETKFSVKYIRHKFGCVDSYSNTAELKRNVLDRSLIQINEQTQIEASYSQVKVKNSIKSFVLHASGLLVTEEQIEQAAELALSRDSLCDVIDATFGSSQPVIASPELQDKIESVVPKDKPKQISKRGRQDTKVSLPSMQLGSQHIQVAKPIPSAIPGGYSRCKVSANGVAIGINGGYFTLSNTKAIKSNKPESSYNYNYNGIDSTAEVVFEEYEGMPQVTQDNSVDFNEPEDSFILGLDAELGLDYELQAPELPLDNPPWFEDTDNELPLDDYSQQSTPSYIAEIAQIPPQVLDPEFDTPDLFDDMFCSKRQRYDFAKKLAKMPELAYLARAGAKEDLELFATQIMNELIDPEKQGFYKPYLDMLGFQSAADN